MFELFADFVVFKLLNLESDTHLSEAVYFFVYDFVKISVLIFLAVSVISFIRTFVSRSIEEFFADSHFMVGSIFASIFGAITPFCSCSSLPLFIGFLKSRVPVGIAFSFLITSPLVNEVAIVILGQYFGWKIAISYTLAGISLGIAGGSVLHLLKVERLLTLDKIFVQQNKEILPTAFVGRLKFSIKDGVETLKKIIIFVSFGVAIGAAIHGFVPESFFVEKVGSLKVFGPIIATLVGIPIYAGCSAVAPVVFSIAQNGIPLGTSLAFMMAIAGLSLPEAVMLKKVMTFKLLTIFFGIVAVGIVLIGYLFNGLIA